jgi:hypothetical protein
MTLFAAIAPQADERLDNAVKAHFGEEDRYLVAPGQYILFAPNLTSQQVSEKLGVPGGGIGRVLILRASNYTGWHARDMWEWMASRSAPPVPPVPTGLHE